ncbi:formate dehydrogenase accessory sulfurtransferase FdhD [Breoghania sp.]|uniref:formate dehydrogenase accessory sulfurtransferase FdhD n=1 Tax=Breoghania sp. TaxID=2065378 RepID=UPI0029CA7CF2|nr:formate dehydrogenase accessory sulfurtransferase FdhD [Breoghania sp.]
MDSRQRDIAVISNGRASAAAMDLIAEEPLSIRVQGNPYAVTMRTPGDEKAHVAGFCLAEGIVDTPDDITGLAFCDGEDTNVVTVTLTATRQEQVADHLDRRTYISQTSCGICGKTIVEDLVQSLSPVADGPPLDGKRALECLLRLSDHQPLRAKTRAAHGAAIYDLDFALLSAAEDVGRHNALDKAVGRLFLDDRLDRAQLLTLSSRISYELVQKAARARIPVVLAISPPHGTGRPTGRGPEYDPGVAGKGRQPYGLLHPPAAGMAGLKPAVAVCQ